MRAPLLIAAVALLLAAPSAVAKPRGPIKISRTGRIGALRLHVSTARDVRRVWGKPQSVLHVRGNSLERRLVDDPDQIGLIKNTRLGYNCHREDGFPDCQTSFCISDRTHRLESFVTTSPQFVLFGRVRVGMNGKLAAKRMHKRIIRLSGEGFTLINKDLIAFVFATHKKVLSISIDHKPGGIGVTEP